MERVAFLIESTGERVACLLNPQTLVVRRTAGVRPRRSAGGLLSGRRLTDDPLLCTGGGVTELDLDLLFDVTLPDAAPVGAPSVAAAANANAASSLGGGLVTTRNGPGADGTAPLAPAVTDVRALTGPLRQLAENPPDGDDAQNAAAPPVVRFVWGKSWNIPGVIVAVAERFEHFTADGDPQRSWLRMRLLRVEEPATPVAPAVSPEASLLAPATSPPAELPPEAAAIEPDQLAAHEVLGGGVEGPGGEPLGGQRMDEIATRYYGTPDAWRFICLFNDIDNPSGVPSGSVLRIPPRFLWEGMR